jgi:hypothetical protein
MSKGIWGVHGPNRKVERIIEIARISCHSIHEHFAIDLLGF